MSRRFRYPLDFGEGRLERRYTRTDCAEADARREAARQPAVPLWELVGIERGWWPPQDTGYTDGIPPGFTEAERPS